MAHKWNTLKNVFTHIYIPHGEKTIFLSRLEDIYTHIHKKCQRTEHRYFWSKAYVIFVGIVNPALLTVAADHCANSLLYSIVYWSIWSLQISSSVITTLSSMVRFDKKHFAYMHYKNRIEEEIWAFVELRDTYSRVDQTIDCERMYHRTFHYTKYKQLLANCERIYKDMCTNACKDNMPSAESGAASTFPALPAPDDSDGNAPSILRPRPRTDAQQWASSRARAVPHATVPTPPPLRHSLSVPCPSGRTYGCTYGRPDAPMAVSPTSPSLPTSPPPPPPPFPHPSYTDPPTRTRA